MKQESVFGSGPSQRLLRLGRWLVPIVLLLAAGFYFLPHASAHASLVRSDPPDNAVRDQPLTGVTAWYDLKLDPAGCTLQVFDSGGREVDLGHGGVDPRDQTVRVMRVNLPGALPPGYYVVRWHATSDEGVHAGHVTEGQFRFRLTAPGISQMRGWAIAGLGLFSMLGSAWAALRRRRSRGDLVVQPVLAGGPGAEGPESPGGAA